MAQSKIIYGFHAVLTALSYHPERVLACYCEEKNSSRQALLVEKANLAQVRIQPISTHKLNELTQTLDHQGVAIQLRMLPPLQEEAFFAWLDKEGKNPLLLFLEGLQDPHNVGACLRSALAFGVDWVVMPKVHTAALNSVVSKVSCGADQLLHCLSVSNLVRFIERIQKAGIWVVGTAVQAPTPLSQIDLARPTALVLGSEEKGIKSLTAARCDQLASIPLVGAMESLNVSVAAGICLYECQRQRHLLP